MLLWLIRRINNGWLHIIRLEIGHGYYGLVLQINLMGKGNLAPTSAMDQVQNYVLGGIIGGVIYSDSIGVFQFSLVLVLWTLLVFTLRFIKIITN